MAKVTSAAAYCVLKSKQLWSNLKLHAYTLTSQNYTIHFVSLQKSDCMPFCAVSWAWTWLGLLLVMLRADKLWPETLRECDDLDFCIIWRIWPNSLPLNSFTISSAILEASQGGNSTGETVKWRWQAWKFGGSPPRWPRMRKSFQQTGQHGFDTAIQLIFASCVGNTSFDEHQYNTSEIFSRYC